MSSYLGSRQLFRNRFGGRTLREIYFGNKLITGFTNADYSADEFIGEKAPAGEAPEIRGTGSQISVMTKNYNPGYAFSRYYCDHIKIVLQYSGGCVFYDCNGNVAVEISGTISFNYLSAEWTIGSKCSIYGKEVFNQSHKQRDTPANLLTYEVYFNTNTRKWTVLFNGGTYTGNEMEWIPTYVRIYAQMWFISSMAGLTTVNGVVYITNMNRGRGMPNAR